MAFVTTVLGEIIDIFSFSAENNSVRKVLIFFKIET